MTRSIRRTKPARVAAAALSSVALLTTLSACGGSATGQEADALSEVSLVFGGALTVCTDSPYAPFVYEEKGKLVGFDVDLGQAVADELKVELDVIDVALIWWRDDDGDTQDLTDVLTDALTTLEDGGLIWLLAPKAGRHGHVPPAEVEEAATTAGLHTTSTIAVAPAWSAYRLTSRGRGR